ncbi:Baculoviral IAP repeat-containing protein 6 [Mycena venus]|uniref:Baculoviral IAP repeat-containing protein 6 n=1 Tax=Mycena venus TaxID=2733690 RepID=A0A8H6Y6M3_9AGAR|nr:Baculoviral IAP repeat-containing protein 6 [Mycena venus]
MSSSEIRQLTEMGATVAQAKAALAQYKDVMQAAERFFEGAFDHVKDEDGDVPMASVSKPAIAKQPIRMATPEDDDDTPAGDGSGDEEDEDDDEFIDYDSDDGPVADGPRTNPDADPYARVFFSKDHREEIIEVEEEPELVHLPGSVEQVKLMTQGEWMKGCPPPSGGEQSFLFALYSQLSEGKCVCPHECGSSVLRQKSDFFPIFPEFSAYITHLQSVVPKTCQRCHSEFCFACGEPITEKVQRPGAAAPGDPLFHCADIQGVILGVGLSMLEQMFTEQSQDSKAAAQDPNKTRNTKRRKTGKFQLKDADDDDDDAYLSNSGGKRSKGGIGYAGDQKEDTTGQQEALAQQAEKDAKIGTLLTQIGVYLPSLHREGHHPSDFLPHPTALAHLRRRFNYVCSALLRNDSLADMSERSVLYFKLLEWLETISAHEALASMMAMPIMTVQSVKSVTTRKSPNNTPIRERTIIYEGSAGPRELLEAIAIQAHAALKALEGVKAPEPTDEELTEEQKRMTVDTKGKSKEVSAPVADENQKLLSFCHRILGTADAIDRSLRETKGDAFVERLHASLPKILTSSSGEEYNVDAGATEESATKAYVEWATRVRFEYCDLTIPPTGPPASNETEPQLPHYKSYYNNEIRMLALSDIPKRSLAIAKELSILTNNLPIAWNSSIFLRIDETRVDVIKALITGPEGTPYYNGCYLFDIFLGPSYNQSPPSVKYMTTNGGKYRFNPNLYADGKVCLSLLGTWSGPGWVSGRSTLLQVLISIQSMILCEEPYLNEPGWANSAGTPQSRAYSANVRRMVVRTAMLGNLQNPPEPFADIIRTHFRLKAKSIAAQLDQWVSLDDGKPTLGDGAGFADGRGPSAGGSSNGLAADVAEMKKLLKEMQAGFKTSTK